MNSDTPNVWHPAASAHFTSRFICIETKSDGLTDPKGKQHLLSPGAGEESMGLAVLDALAYSRRLTWLESETLMWGRGGAGEERYEKWVGNLQQLYGYKSRTALLKNMSLCGIKRQNGEIIFTPMVHVKLQAWESARNDGIEDIAIPSESTAEQIGAALKLALSRCS